MAGYTATAEELAGLAKQILDVDASTQGTLRSVANTVETVKGTWRGSAATAFGALMERFNADAAKLQEALRGIAEQMDKSSVTYAQQEEEATNLSSVISNRLG
ncbi:WXG100 family type VII secretion target [Lentzea sp. NPDC054927]